ERQQLRRGQLGREDQVALVLPVLVVDDDHRPPGRDGQDRVFNAAQHQRTNFSTYFAITSTSRLTGAPTATRPSVVTSSVVGIRLTASESPSIQDTVSDTPSTVIDPFSTTYR